MSGTMRTRSKCSNRPQKWTGSGRGGSSLARLIDSSVGGGGSSDPGGGFGLVGVSGPDGKFGSEGEFGVDGGFGTVGGAGPAGLLGPEGGFGSEGALGVDGSPCPGGGSGSDGNSGTGGGSDPAARPAQSIQNGAPTQGSDVEGMSYDLLIGPLFPNAAFDFTGPVQILSPTWSAKRTFFATSLVSRPGCLPSSIKILLS